MGRISLRGAGRGDYRPGKALVTQALWIGVEWAVVTNALQLSSTVRVCALRAFGAKIGSRVIVRPRLRVKYPWNLTVGDDCWIGEGVWIHNQAPVSIGNDAVVSQDTLITTGSHDIAETMDLVIRPVRIEDGAWVAARCVVLQGSDIGADAVVAAGSVVQGILPSGGVYRGNPAVWIRSRVREV